MSDKDALLFKLSYIVGVCNMTLSALGLSDYRLTAITDESRMVVSKPLSGPPLFSLEFTRLDPHHYEFLSPETGSLFVTGNETDAGSRAFMEEAKDLLGAYLIRRLLDKDRKNT